MAISKEDEEKIVKIASTSFANLFNNYESPFQKLAKIAKEKGHFTGEDVVKACEDAHGNKQSG